MCGKMSECDLPCPRHICAACFVSWVQRDGPALEAIEVGALSPLGVLENQVKGSGVFVEIKRHGGTDVKLAFEIFSVFSEFRSPPLNFSIPAFQVK
jgi:hypothetical protein